MRDTDYKIFVSKLKQVAEDEIAFVGGYWPVLLAIGATAEYFGNAVKLMKSGNTTASSQEFINAFWMLTCVSNQYCSELGQIAEKEWRKLEPISGPEDMRDMILIGISELHKIANRYEQGYTTDFKPSEPIGNVIVRLHFAILNAVEHLGGNAETLIQKRINEVRAKPGNQHTQRFDPSTGESMRRFRLIANATACPFAKTAKVWACPVWGKNQPVEKYLYESNSTLKRFSRVCQNERLDGIAIETLAVTNLQDLQERTVRLLTELAKLSDPNPMMLAIERKEWKYALANIPTFVSVFSSIYPENHLRQSETNISTFFFFQPLSAFKAKQSKRKIEKITIRQSFRDRGQDYGAVLGKVRFEAEKFIKPIDLKNDGLVEWWKVPTN